MRLRILPLTRGAGGVFLLGLVPRVGFELAQAEGDLLLLAVDAEDDGLDLLVRLEHVGRFGDALGPGQFGDMDQPFDAGFEFDERAVGNQVDDPAFDFGADGVLLFDGVPRVGQLLLEAQADALFLAVDVEHDHVDVLADLEDFGGVADAAPAHVGDVQQAVNAVEIDEGAEVGDVLDGALADVARGHFGEQLLAALGAFLLDQFAAGQDDVLPLLVDLDDLEIVGVADVLGEVLRGEDVNLRGGQKGLDADVDEQAAFDDGFDFAGDGAAFVADGEDAFPVLFELRLLLGEDDHALLVFELLDQDIDLVADLDGLDVFKFVCGDDALALVADVHEDFFGADFDDGAFDDIASSKGQFARLPQGLFHGQHNIITNLLAMNLRETWSARGFPRLHCLTDQSLRWQRRLKVRFFVNFYFSASMDIRTHGVQAT